MILSIFNFFFNLLMMKQIPNAHETFPKKYNKTKSSFFVMFFSFNILKQQNKKIKTIGINYFFIYYWLCICFKLNFLFIENSFLNCISSFSYKSVKLADNLSSKLIYSHLSVIKSYLFLKPLL